MWALEQKNSCLHGNSCSCCELIHRSCTCSEEEHGHGAVVLSLCTTAKGDEGHQKGHQCCHGTGHQQHQGGNLPVCGMGHTTQVRVEHPPPQQKLDSHDCTGELNRCVDKHRRRTNPTEWSESRTRSHHQDTLHQEKQITRTWQVTNLLAVTSYYVWFMFSGFIFVLYFYSCYL